MLEHVTFFENISTTLIEIISTRGTKKLNFLCEASITSSYQILGFLETLMLHILTINMYNEQWQELE